MRMKTNVDAQLGRSEFIVAAFVENDRLQRFEWYTTGATILPHGIASLRFLFSTRSREPYWWPMSDPLPPVARTCRTMRCTYRLRDKRIVQLLKCDPVST